MQRTKKLTAVFLLVSVLLMTVSFSPLPVSADAEYPAVCVYGDNIIVYEPYEVLSFPFLAFDYLDVKDVWYAIRHANSTALMSNLQRVSFFDEEIAHAEEFYLSVEGDYYLNLMMNIVNRYKADGDTMNDVAAKMKADSDAVAAAFGTLSSQTSSVKASLTALVDWIKARNREAKFYLLSVYNPFESKDSNSDIQWLHALADSVILPINEAINEADVDGVIPVYDLFKDTSKNSQPIAIKDKI